MAGSGEERIEDLQAEVKRLKKENEKLRVSNRRWMRIAGTDPLTGLPNKVFFSTALLPQLISQSNTEQIPFACIILAPDQLGEINQKYGREGGNQVVTEVAAFLKENLASGERLVHFDGANFVVLIPQGDLQKAKVRSLAMRARVLSRPFKCGEGVVSLTMSMGSVSRSPSPSETQVNAKKVIDKILQKLATVLDQAKKEGRDKLIEDKETVF